MLKNKKYTLRKELLLVCIIAFLISFSFYKVVSAVGIQIISEHYSTGNRIKKLEKKYAKELQKYIKEKSIDIKDISLIDTWNSENEDVYLKLFYKGNLIYDTLYGLLDYSKIPVENIQNYSKVRVYPVQVGNEEMYATILCYDFKMENNYKILVLICTMLIFATIVLYGVKNKIDYLMVISNEVEKLTEDLNSRITIKGNDEIYHVAKGIDELRASVISRIEKEKEAYNSNIELITTLSHDIKTPLTSVISYIELVAERLEGDNESVEFLNIALEKSMGLRNITNNLFEHFLLKSKAYNITFDQVNGNELVAQMVEENLLDLEARGVIVSRTVEDINSVLNVNIDLIYRVFENVFSNISKYADFEKELKVKYHLKNKWLEIIIRNVKKHQKNCNELSTQIGLKNCKSIMERHYGKMKIIDLKDAFTVVLRFPIE